MDVVTHLTQYLSPLPPCQVTSYFDFQLIPLHSPPLSIPSLLQPHNSTLFFYSSSLNTLHWELKAISLSALSPKLIHFPVFDKLSVFAQELCYTAFIYTCLRLISAIMFLYPGIMAPPTLTFAPAYIFATPMPVAVAQKTEEKKPDPPKPEPPKTHCSGHNNYSCSHHCGPNIQVNYGHAMNSSMCGMYKSPFSVFTFEI